MADLQGLAPAPASQQARVGQWKQRLVTQRAQLREEFSVRNSPRELLRRQSAMVDRLLKDLWAAHAMPRNVALAAVGGYGRGQLFPCSDVDLLILLTAPADGALAAKIENLVGTLWDIGIEVGHSVRTLDQCVELAADDVTVQTTLLEARLLAGKRELFARFTKRMREVLDPAKFLQAKLLEQQQRHVRHAETNLEPNIKESAGGSSPSVRLSLQASQRQSRHALWSGASPPIAADFGGTRRANADRIATAESGVKYHEPGERSEGDRPACRCAHAGYVRLVGLKTAAGEASARRRAGWRVRRRHRSRPRR
jgi:hypothetical protein